MSEGHTVEERDTGPISIPIIDYDDDDDDRESITKRSLLLVTVS